MSTANKEIAESIESPDKVSVASFRIGSGANLFSVPRPGWFTGPGPWIYPDAQSSLLKCSKLSVSPLGSEGILDLHGGSQSTVPVSRFDPSQTVARYPFARSGLPGCCQVFPSFHCQKRYSLISTMTGWESVDDSRLDVLRNCVASEEWMGGYEHMEMRDPTPVGRPGWTSAMQMSSGLHGYAII